MDGFGKARGNIPGLMRGAATMALSAAGVIRSLAGDCKPEYSRSTVGLIDASVFRRLPPALRVGGIGAGWMRLFDRMFSGRDYAAL